MTIATFTTTMGNQEGIDNINGAFDKTIGHIHDGTDMNGGIISYNSLKDKPTNMATADKLRTPRTINGVPFDGSENIAIAVSSGQVGVVDNIVNGMEITVGTGLQAIVSAGRAIIDETVVNFTNPLTITLEPRMASLVYAKVDGSIGKVDAEFPEASTQTLRYILDGSPTISSTGSVANLATKTGAVNATDGHIGYSGKGDGTTGYYTCASATGVPAYSSASTRILVIDNFVSNGAIQIFHNDGISKFGCTATNNLTVNGVDTLFTLENGGAYKIALPSAASTASATAYVNGSPVNTGAYITNTTAVTPTFYSGASGASKSPSQLAYFEYYATKLNSAQIAQISNALLLPCSYANIVETPKTIIDSELTVDHDLTDKANLVDGNATTSWGWKSTSTFPHKINYAPTVPVALNYVKLTPFTIRPGEYGIKNVSIFGSFNNVDFYKIYEGAQANVADTRKHEFNNVIVYPYYKIEIDSYSSSGAYSAVAEIVFGNQTIGQSDIREVLPANSISLGRVNTTSTGLKEIRMDYQDGRREEAVGGNRKVFLGWKYFSGATTLKWDNPFGTRKVKTVYVWAQDANGTNESDVQTSSSSTGLTMVSTSNNRMQCMTQFGGVSYSNGIWQTTGYIGCYAEVIE